MGKSEEKIANIAGENNLAKQGQQNIGDSPARQMRANLRQSFLHQQNYKADNARLAATRTANIADNATIKGMSFPHALAKIAKGWLGNNTPSNQALDARFGKQPTEEAIFALANELHAEIKVHQGSLKKLILAPTPFIAELKNGSAIIILSLKKQRAKYIDAEGEKLISTPNLLSQLSSNYVLVFQAIKPSTNKAISPLREKISKEAKTHSQRLLRFIGLCFRGNKQDLTKLLISAAFSNSLLITLPLFITIVYDRVVPHGAFETLTALTIGVLLALIIDIGLRAARVNLQEAIGVKSALRLHSAIYRKLVTIPLQAGQRATKGFFTLLPELDHAALLMPGIVSGIIADLPFVIIMLGLIYILTGPVVFVPIIGILLIALTVLISNMKASKMADIVHDAKVQVQDQAIETCATLATTKATRSEHLLLNQWAQRTDNNAYLTHKIRQTMAISQQLVLNITQMTIVMTIVAGAIQVNSGAMTLGNLAAATLLVGRVISPVSQLIAQLGQFANIQVSINNIFSLLDEVEEFGGDENSTIANNFKGNISFNNVSFAYEGAQRQSLSDINLTIKEGEKIGIIGRNGCGKSTLLKMIPRFYLPSEGTIMLDGVDARQISPFLLRQSIGFMSQDTILMNTTIRENICMGAGEVSEEEFEFAAKLAGVSNFTKNHPQGFNLIAGPRGEHLSGGERQAVGLARAILQNPKVLILDEPTSAMDNSAEDRIIREFAPFLAGKTVIIATHRMQLLKLVDRIIWMDNSRIIADGPKEEILAKLVKKAS